MKMLTLLEVLYLNNEPVIISHKDKGIWHDTAQAVQSFMDMNTLTLESGARLDMDEYGIVWIAYRAAAQPRYVNLF